MNTATQNDQVAKKLATAIQSMGYTKSGKDMSRGHALEVVSKVAGLPNWDTLSGLLSGKKEEFVQSDYSKYHHVRLYMSCGCSDEWADTPSFAWIDITPGFLNNIEQMIWVSKKYNLMDVRDLHDAYWDNDKDFRMQGCTLRVNTHGEFSFSASPKHCNIDVYTCDEALNGLIQDLEEALSSGVHYIGADDSSVFERVECTSVEYDLKYTGGDYNDVGCFVYVPNDVIEKANGDVNAAFQAFTGIDHIHVVSYSQDETFNLEGDTIDE